MEATATPRQQDNVTVIDIAGRITLNGGLGAVRAAIRTAVGEGRRNILLNLEGVSYIDSAGLGELASAYITVSNLGGQLKLVNTQDRVHGMLQVTKLYTLLVTFPDEEAALASF
jgi:anti-sigma B factor antagonist